MILVILEPNGTLNVSMTGYGDSPQARAARGTGRAGRGGPGPRTQLGTSGCSWSPAHRKGYVR